MKRTPLRRGAPPRRRTPLTSTAVLVCRTPLRAKGNRPGWRQARAFVKGRAGGRCEAQVPGCAGRGSHAHHIRMRSQGGSDDPGNLLWVCPPCHRWTHDHPAEAAALGLLARSAA